MIVNNTMNEQAGVCYMSDVPEGLVSAGLFTGGPAK
ncbi:hypothetical protein SAMN04488122_4942 [Chitinophaga arvensicola]|uniref:Uncharacterized protein n=1 Tax=Chitinophaga arvensicola TaxID=29529 RepID=A0A1I0S8V5_9BACT|nr:hypothetical protein SAMN04488122_4942 [Chitinophaga arvensicola]